MMILVARRASSTDQISMDAYAEADAVLVVDENGHTSVVKNRHGDTGDVYRETP